MPDHRANHAPRPSRRKINCDQHHSPQPQSRRRITPGARRGGPPWAAPPGKKTKKNGTQARLALGTANRAPLLTREPRAATTTAAPRGCRLPGHMRLAIGAGPLPPPSAPPSPPPFAAAIAQTHQPTHPPTPNTGRHHHPPHPCCHPPQQQTNNSLQLQATSAQSSSKSTTCCGHELATYLAESKDISQM